MYTHTRVTRVYKFKRPFARGSYFNDRYVNLYTARVEVHKFHGYTLIL